ncbi:MAG TPA: VCBS repeat-containing protein [Thermoanaerobaculia bacterium]|nr:VCBS repeat-containing protein [Thermoanaerobaculia bacterium]
MRLPILRPSLCLALLFSFGGPAGASGYNLYRLTLWGRPGELPPRLQQDPVSNAFVVLFPSTPPESGWDGAPARKLEIHGGAFLPAADASINRPRDPDPDWALTDLEGSLDINRDGIAEIVRARTVMIPDRRDPSASVQRVVVEILEGDRVLFSDLVDGPSAGSVSAHSIAITDFTGEGYTDFIVFLEAAGQTGAAFYSQAALRSPAGMSRRIEGSSSSFQCDGYGIFDLSRSARDFFTHLPSSALPDRPGCPESKGTEADGLVHCGFSFNSPYLGWISRFQASFKPSGPLASFDLYFPVNGGTLTPEQALSFLIPVFGGEFRPTSSVRRSGVKEMAWRWSTKKSAAVLSGLEENGKPRCVALRLERR